MVSPILSVWSLLRQRFEAHSEAATGWDGTGTGDVVVSESADGQLIFEETGTWQPVGRSSVRFSNVYRWSLMGDLLRLEHLRFGPDNPVFLFDMAADSEGECREVTPHLCREDCYTAIMTVSDNSLVLAWSIQGPRKRESIRYQYSLWASNALPSPRL